MYWIGCRQRQPLARAFALLLQVGAALAFAPATCSPATRLFLNATFLGSGADRAGRARHGVRRRPAIATTSPAASARWSRVLVLWGVGWWYCGGALEIVARVAGTRSEANAILAFAAGQRDALALARCAASLRWPRLAWFGAALLPRDGRRRVRRLGPHAHDAHRVRLARVAARVGRRTGPCCARPMRCARPARRTAGPARGVSCAFAHAASAIALVAWVAWEASEWVGRAFPDGTVWIACAAAWPAIAYLAARDARQRVGRAGRSNAYRDAYAMSAAHRDRRAARRVVRDRQRDLARRRRAAAVRAGRSIRSTSR